MFRPTLLTSALPGAPALAGPWVGAPVITTDGKKNQDRRSATHVSQALTPLAFWCARASGSGKGELNRKISDEDLRKVSYTSPAVRTRSGRRSGDSFQPTTLTQIICHAGALRVVSSLGMGCLRLWSMLRQVSGGVTPLAAPLWPTSRSSGVKLEQQYFTFYRVVLGDTSYCCCLYSYTEKGQRS